jgi:hypothetical protein
MRIRALIVHYLDVVNAIRPIYLDGNGKMALPLHGHEDGTEATLVLEPDEYVTEISGRTGTLVDSLTVETNLGTRQAFGGTGGGPIEGYELPPDTDRPQEVVAFFGACGQRLDSIGINTRPAP